MINFWTCRLKQNLWLTSTPRLLFAELKMLGLSRLLLTMTGCFNCRDSLMVSIICSVTECHKRCYSQCSQATNLSEGFSKVITPTQIDKPIKWNVYMHNPFNCWLPYHSVMQWASLTATRHKFSRKAGDLNMLRHGGTTATSGDINTKKQTRNSYDNFANISTVSNPPNRKDPAETSENMVELSIWIIQLLNLQECWFIQNYMLQSHDNRGVIPADSWVLSVDLGPNR